MNEYIQTSSIIIHGLFAVFGAVVHALDSHRKGQSKSLVDFAALTVMSSFTGAMFALLGLYLFGNDSYLTMAMAGTGGYLGVEGMAIVVEKIKSLSK